MALHPDYESVRHDRRVVDARRALRAAHRQLQRSRSVRSESAVSRALAMLNQEVSRAIRPDRAEGNGT